MSPGPMIGFVGTADLDRARGFYGGILGLRVVEQTPYACVFDVDGTMLRATLVPAVEPVGYTVLGWQVDDIATRVRELGTAGVEFARYDGIPQDDEGIWITPGGDKIAWFTDPDRNVLSLTEFAES